MESEETAAILKRKHQEIVVDFQEQIDSVTKAKSRLGYVVFCGVDTFLIRLVVLERRQVALAQTMCLKYQKIGFCLEFERRWVKR